MKRKKITSKEMVAVILSLFFLSFSGMIILSIFELYYCAKIAGGISICSFCIGIGLHLARNYIKGE